jgi:hypothetical protein
MPGKRPYLLGILLAGLCSAAPFLYGEGPLGGDAPEASVPATPGVDSAVQMAQEEVRDPFGSPFDQNTPVDMTSASVDAPVIAVDLQGIGFGSKDAYAVIGGEVFLVGDEKQGIKLLEVRRHEVDILVNGGMSTFSLYPGPELKNTMERELGKRGGVVPPFNQPKEKESSFPRREQPLS